MNLDMNDRTAVERRLWDEIERHQVGMLGIVGADVHHTQPMTAFVEGHDLWFFTRADTDLARRVGEGHEAIFVFQAKDLYACLSGELPKLLLEGRFPPKSVIPVSVDPVQEPGVFHFGEPAAVG